MDREEEEKGTESRWKKMGVDEKEKGAGEDLNEPQ